MAFCITCNRELVDNNPCVCADSQQATEQHHTQPDLQQPYSQPYPQPSLQYISGKPSFVADLIILIINIVIDISFLLSGQYIWFFALLAFTVFPAARLIRTLKSGIVVDNAGVSGKVKGEQFRFAYHEISSASMADDEMNSKNLLIVSGYQSYSIRIRNARAVRDTIAHNMAALGVTPAPIEKK